MNSPKVSVIIPVYNVDHYLEQCVNSILGQSFGDFELILVDDGSTDRSGAICDEYEKKDVRVKVIHQQNAGSSAARNTGLKVANGIYILFVDADDWVNPNHIESMVETAERESADVVFCGFFYEYPKKSVVFDNHPQSSTGRGVVIESFKNRLHAGVQYKLIQRSLLADNQLSFPKYGYYEDMYLSTEILFHARKIVSTGSVTYHYRYNPLSETNESNPSVRIEKYYEFIRNMEELASKLSLWDDAELEAALYDMINRNKIILLELPFSAKQEILRGYESFPDSWKWYNVGVSLARMFYYFALRFRVLLFAQIYKHFRIIVRNKLKGI